MAEVTRELIHAGLTSMPGRLSNIDHRLVDANGGLETLTSQMRGVSMKINGAHGDVANLYKTLGRFDQRLGRLENRLDIIDEPAE